MKTNTCEKMVRNDSGSSGINRVIDPKDLDTELKQAAIQYGGCF